MKHMLRQVFRSGKFVTGFVIFMAVSYTHLDVYKRQAPYGIGASLPTAFFNLESPGLDQVAVRKAIAMAVDYPTIIANAMTNQSATFDQVPRSLMNPTPGEQATFDPVSYTHLDVYKRQAVDRLGRDVLDRLLPQALFQVRRGKQ